MPSPWTWPLASPVKLRVPVSSFNWNPGPFTALPASTVTDAKDTTVDFVPYGCTYFRISMLPVTAKAWAPPATRAMPGTVPPTYRSRLQRQTSLSGARILTLDGRVVVQSGSGRNAAAIRALRPGCYIVDAQQDGLSRMTTVR